MKIVDGWLDTANEYNLMQNSMSRLGYKPTHLVIHGTAGGSYGNDVIAYMATASVSTHFVISIDGTIWQAVSMSSAAWANAPLNAPRLNFDNANANPNYWTISIEFCKPDTTNQINITNAQLASGIALTTLICDTYNIPKRRGDGHAGIISHADINSIDRAMCPGTFPWDALIAGINTNQSAQGGTTMTVPSGWKDTGSVLTAPNNIPITDGFRTYVLSHAWDPANIPLEPAHGLSPLELSNPGLGSGTRQTFRWVALEWTSKAGVFESSVGQELVAVLKLLSSTQASLQSLRVIYDAIVIEKNGLIGAKDQLAAQVIQLNAEIAQLKAQPSGNDVQLQQQIATLDQQNIALAAQVKAYYDKLQQIVTDANQIATFAKQ